MIIKMAGETEQNKNPYKDTLLFHKIESMERKYNEQFQLFTLCIAQHSYKFDAVYYADNTRFSWQKQKWKLNSKNNLFIENDSNDKLAIVEMDNVFSDSESIFQERASDKKRYIYKKAWEVSRPQT
jgi:hypothetical protein